MFRVVVIWITSFLFFTADAQTGEDILEAHFNSYGQKFWDELQTVSVDGRWVDEDYYGYSMELTYKRPEKIRIEGVHKGKRYVEAFDGTLAWIVAPWKEEYTTGLMDAEEEVIIQNSFSLGSPMNKYREELTFAGLEDKYGELYHVFDLDRGAYKKRFFLDRENNRLHYEEIETKYGSEPIRLMKIYEKYRSYQGLLMPTAVRFVGDDLEKELIFDDVVVGVGARDSIFEMPKGQ